MSTSNYHRTMSAGTQAFYLFISSQLIVSLSNAIVNAKSTLGALTYYFFLGFMLYLFLKVVIQYAFDDYPTKFLRQASRPKTFQTIKDSVKKIKPATIALGFLALFTVTLTLSLIMIRQHNIVLQPNNEAIKELLIKAPVLMCTIAIIIAPICEELVYRELLPRLFKYHILAYLLATLVFLLLHQPYGIFGWLTYGSIGLIFMCVRLYSKSVINSIILHMLWNMLAIYQLSTQIVPQ